MKISKVIQAISNVCAVIAMLQVLTLMLVMVYDVAGRFVFNSPTIWAYELSTMLAGTLFYLAAGYTLRERGHIAIDFLSNKFPQRVNNLIHIAFYSLVLVPILSWISWVLISKTWSAFVTGKVDYTNPWAPLLWPFYAAISIGLVVLLLETFMLIAYMLRQTLGNNNCSDYG